MGLSSSPSRSTGGLQEGEKVGQIRKRVRDLSWKQRKEGHRDDGLEENDEDEEEERKVDDTESKESDGEGEESQTKAETEGKPPPLPRRTQPTCESFSSPSSPDSASYRWTSLDRDHILDYHCIPLVKGISNHTDELCGTPVLCCGVFLFRLLPTRMWLIVLHRLD